MKKILAIAPYPYLPFFSGGQKLIAEFFEWLGKETELTVISSEANDWTLAKNYRALPLLKKSFSRYFDRSLVKKITAEIQQHHYDAVIWEHPYYAWLAFRVKKRTGIRTIIHTHNIEYQRFRSTGKWWWPILKRYEKWCFKKADLIFFISADEKKFAIDNWNIPPQKCIDVPFGVELRDFPADRNDYRKLIMDRHQINPDEKILFFNGLLDYKPNLDALKVILEKINPLLMAKSLFRYKIIICGKRLPPEMNSLNDYIDKNIIYGGYAEKIEGYYKASDLLLNPVQTGGGVKTKVIEAIAYGTSVISTESGALGIEKKVCGNKMVVVPDNQWEQFTEAVIKNINTALPTPAEYYQHYYWGHIIQNINAII